MKNNIKKLSIYLIAIFVVGLIFAKKALAVCPICTVVVGAGIGLSRWLGIDDSITGLWIGGLIVSIIAWTISWLAKKKINFRGRDIIVVVGYYLFTIAPLYFMKVIGNPLDSLCGCGLDKLLLGIIVGSSAFYFGASWYYFLKEKNGGHAYFPFQKVVMPISPLIILSIVFYFLTK
jgi:hypothetical protein